MKIKKILVSQPKPDTENSPYLEFAKKYNIQWIFRPFIHGESVSAKEFREQKISILDHSAILFTSRTAIDHFFALCKELRVVMPDTMKYLCISEATAVYLQKYVQYRKRKIIFADGKFDSLIEISKKYINEKILVPLSDVHKKEIPEKLTAAKFNWTKAIFYKTVSSNLSDVNIKDYDIIVFFSPSGIASLKKNFPDFVQGETYIGAFGPATGKAVTDAGLRLDIPAPTVKCTSMTAALEDFVKKLK